MSIEQQSSSYRRGLVLGLTMAETMLLLVFCLLIAAASIFTHTKEQQAAQAEASEQLRVKLAKAEKQLRAANRQVAALRRYRSMSDQAGENWRRLVVEEVEAVETLQKAGIRLKDAAAAAPIIAEVLDAYKEGNLKEGEITGSIQLRQEITREFAAEPAGQPNPKEIAAFAKKGLEASKGPAQAEGHKWPPIITLSEAGKFHFETGSAELSPEFRAALSAKILDDLLANIAEFPDVNVIEVIGHTDEQRITRATSNLDERLPPVLQNGAPVAELTPADNAGLGLARAVAVVQVLKAANALSRFSILPYSGAQLIDVTDVVPSAPTYGDVRERRRIEIRLRKSEKYTGVPVSAPRSAPVPPPAPGTLETKARPKQKEQKPSSPFDLFNW